MLKSRNSYRFQKILGRISVWLGLLFFIVILLFPFYFMFISSFKPNDELYNLSKNPLMIESWTLDHYTYLLKQTRFIQWLKNSTLVAVVSTGISIVIGTIAAYSLARLRYRGVQALGMVIFISYLIPTTLLFIPLAYVVRNLGLFDKQVALMITYPTFLIPFCTWLLMGYFRGIPKELEESAMVDGATRLQALRMIILPIMIPGIVSAGLFAFTLSWNEFVYALTLAQTESIKTLPVGIVSQLVLADVYFWGELMGAALLGSVPIALLYSFFLEYYVKGMTAGAVKG
jgi:multiple sugar transport system permease protein